MTTHTLTAHEWAGGTEFCFEVGDVVEVVAIPTTGTGLAVVRYQGDHPNTPAHLRAAIGPCRVSPLALSLATSCP